MGTGEVKHLLLAGWIATIGCDAATTNVALRQGAQEWMIPTQNRAVINSIFVAQAVVGYIAFKNLRKTHPKLAATLYVVAVIAHGTAAAWNFKQLR